MLLLGRYSLCFFYLLPVLFFFFPVEMSLKYKSPLIRSKNTSVASDDASPNAQKPIQLADNKLSNILVYDNNPQHLSPVTPQWRGRGCSSPRFNSPNLRGSPYQWTPPNRMNNSWSSNVNNSII